MPTKSDQRILHSASLLFSTWHGPGNRERKNLPALEDCSLLCRGGCGDTHDEVIVWDLCCLERMTSSLGRKQRGSQSYLVLFLVLVPEARRGGSWHRPEQTVSAETQLLGVEKPEVSGSVSELLPSVPE